MRRKDLARLAEEQLRVFPFKNVRSCWFRLFTDTHLLKAIRHFETFYLDSDSHDDGSGAGHYLSDQSV